MLRELGVRLWADGASLRFRAPLGVMTAELKAEVAAHKLEPGATLKAAVDPASNKLLLSGTGGPNARTVVNYRAINPSGTQTFRSSTLGSLNGSCSLSGGGCRKR